MDLVKTFTEQLRAEVVAHTGCTIVQTDDEKRLLRRCAEVAKEQRRDLWSWTLARGLQCLSDPSKGDPAAQEVAQLFIGLLQWQEGPAIVVAYDIVSWINHPENGGPITARLIRELVDQQTELNDSAVRGLLPTDGPRAAGTPEDPANRIVQLVICDSEQMRRPCGASTVHLGLPDVIETTELVERFSQHRDYRPEQQLHEVIRALAGLTAHQQEQALLLSYAVDDQLDPAEVLEFKRRQLQARGITWEDPDPRGFGGLGGLEPLKLWLRRRGATFDRKRAAEYGVQPARGAILSGPPGVGKSHLARALAQEWGCPLLRFDLGAMRGRFHGESETWTQQALDVVDAICPTGYKGVVWLDEGDRQTSGATGDGAHDGGVAGRVLQKLLTWMQERESDAFLFITSNHPEQFPPELTRPGRIDSCWWLDYPTPVERRAILALYRDRHPQATDTNIETLVQRTDGRTGAEIKEAFNEAALQAMHDGLDCIRTLDVVVQLDLLPKVVDTFHLSTAKARWRDSARKANNEIVTDLSDQTVVVVDQSDDEPGQSHQSSQHRPN